MTTLPLNLNLTDGDGFLWDIRTFNPALPLISNGTRDAYDGGFEVVTPGGLSGNIANGIGEDGNREVAYGPLTMTAQGGDIEITRKIYVPEDAGFARILDSLTNTSDAEVTFEYGIFTNLGSDGSTRIIDTSSGDQSFSPEDTWIVTDDFSLTGGDPAVAHVFGNGGGLAPVSASLSFDDIRYSFTLTLAPGETRSLLQFGVQANTPDGAIDTAEALTALLPDGLDGLSAQELDQIVNFDLDIPRTPVTLDGTGGDDLLEGGVFEDTLRGLGGDDTLIGNSSGDLLDGGAGNDSVTGARGNDTIDGGTGNDTAEGGSGADNISGGAGDDTLNGDSGNDTVTGDGGNDLLRGGRGNDDLAGNDGDDDIAGEDGSDTLDGGNGQDSLWGGNANDSLSGGDDDDRLFGDWGNDTLLGGAGNDSIGGGNDRDRIFAGAGDDTVTGDAIGSDVFEYGNDLINGMEGNDLLSGGRGDDTIAGQDGNDTIAGGTGDDLLFGGLGDDFLFGGIGGTDRVWGGDGADKFFSTGVRGSVTQVVDYDASEGDVLVVDGQFFDPSDFEVRGVTAVQPGVPGTTFRPTELVRVLPSGDAVTLFTFGADFAGDRVVLRLPFEDSGDTAVFDFL